MNKWPTNFTILYLCLIYGFLCFARDLPVIDIPNQGKIIGKEVSKLRIQKIIAYYGIPYAAPPVDDLRFAPPVTNELPSWDGVKNNTDYADSCLQTKEDYKESELPFLQLLSDDIFQNMSEDCLYLNVFVPQGTVPTSGFATIIWFHPGNFTTGTPAIWNPHTLVYRQRVILVTVAWRLNIMGFFTSMDGEAPGNFGLMDQQAAMKWVKNNIKIFGGNPDNICIMGYGTGAMSIGLHMINPYSRTLFNKAIAMSGYFMQPSAVKMPDEDVDLLDKLAKDFGCIRKPTSRLMECLRGAGGQQLVEQTANVNWRPLLDKDLSNSTPPFLSELPRYEYDRGEFEKVPLLTGYTNMEQILEYVEIDNITSNISSDVLQQLLADILSSDIPQINSTDVSCTYNYNHIIDAVMFFYGSGIPVKNVDVFRKTVADFLTERTYASSSYLHATYTSVDQPTYVYRFDMKPSTEYAIKNIPEWVQVPHLFDLLYVWGVPYWRTDQEWDPRDKRISETIMSFWTNFAKFSNPTENSIYPIKWEPFTRENPGILIIDGIFNMSNSNSLNYKAFDFWNNFYPKVLEVSTQCCGILDSASSINLTKNLLLIFFATVLLCNVNI